MNGFIEDLHEISIFIKFSFIPTIIVIIILTNNNKWQVADAHKQPSMKVCRGRGTNS
jgi:hypothetical protein